MRSAPGWRSARSPAVGYPPGQPATRGADSGCRRVSLTRVHANACGCAPVCHRVPGPGCGCLNLTCRHWALTYLASWRPGGPRWAFLSKGNFDFHRLFSAGSAPRNHLGSLPQLQDPFISILQIIWPSQGPPMLSTKASAAVLAFQSWTPRGAP